MAAHMATRNFCCLCVFHRQLRQGLLKCHRIREVPQCHFIKNRSASLHTSAGCGAGAKWREEQGLPLSGNEYGPLTDTPDWCYADGRPAPPSKGALRRKEEQRELAMKIDQLAQEVMDAKENHRILMKEREDEELDRQRRELKTKGIMASKFKDRKTRQWRKKRTDGEDVSQVDDC